MTTKPVFASEDIMTFRQSSSTLNDCSGTTSGNIIVTNQSRVACNGGGGPLGHPRIWLTLGPEGRVICPYCSRIFSKAAE